MFWNFTGTCLGLSSPGFPVAEPEAEGFRAAVSLETSAISVNTQQSREECYEDPLLIKLAAASEVKAPQLCPTLRKRMDCYLPGSSVHGTLQARVLEWVAISFSRGSFRPKDSTQVSCIAGRLFTVWAASYCVLITVRSVWRALQIQFISSSQPSNE